MKLLAIETTGDACSCAIVVDETRYERHRLAPRRHAELVLAMVRELLDEAGLELAELDALAFGRGPGSFTGVRVASSVAQGLAYGAGLPVVPVSSLQALAQGACREGGYTKVLAAFDARMDEVYWGIYAADGDGLMMPQAEECVCAAHAVPVPPAGDWVGVGEGWCAYGDVLSARVGERLVSVEAQRLARALDVAILARAAHASGESVAASSALPVYLRNRVARKRGE